MPTFLTPASVLLMVQRLVVVATAACVLTELMARAGSAPGSLVFRRARGPGRALDRFGVQLLLALFGLGTAYLGLALCGLSRSPVVLGVPVLMLVAARDGRRWHSPGLAAARELLLAAGPRWLGLVAAGVLPFAAILVVPDTEQDSLLYHLGMPWHSLAAGRIPLGQVPLSFHVALPVDIVYLLPLALDDERLCKWIGKISCAGAAAVFAASQVRAGRPAALPLFALFMLASPTVHGLMANTKNDLGAVSLLLAGAWLQLGGRWIVGAVLIGSAGAAKLVLWPFVALWAVALLPPRDRRWHCAALMVVPSLAWWIKAWLAVGNPFFPFATDRLPTLDWGDLNRAVFNATQRGIALPDALSWKTLAGCWLSQMRFLHLSVLLALPAAWLVRGRYRRAVLVALAGSLLILWLGKISRYMLGPVALAGMVCAAGLARLDGPLGARLRGAIILHALCYAWLPQWRNPVARLAFLPEAEVRAQAFTTFAEALEQVAPLRPQRVLQIGEIRTHRLPGPLRYDATTGETPVPWKIAHASHDLTGMAKRYRQMGVRWLLYNYVTVEWQSTTYWRYEWAEAALRRHIEFCKRHLVIRSSTETSDYLNGGFYIFEILRAPVARPPKTIWFAPGTENLYGMGILLHGSGRLQDALNYYKSVRDRMPDVGMAWNSLGHQYLMASDAEQAFLALHPFTSQGMFDSINLGEYGTAALRTGRLAIAGPVLLECLRRYPSHRSVIRVNLGALSGAKAIEALRQRNPAAALGFLDEGEAQLGLVPRAADPKEGNEVARRQTLAMLYGIRGEMAFAEQETAQALRYLRQAIETAPESRGAERWRQIIASLEPAPFGPR